MFTGLIETKVRVVALEALPASAAAARLAVANPWRQQTGGSPSPARDTPAAGDSIAVDGCCLTVVAPAPADAATLDFALGAETLARTTLGQLRVGDWVHLERALAFGDRLGGHLVSGHVDGCGTVQTREMRGESLYLGIDVPQAVAALTAAQGSVTLAGVSLTVTAVEGCRLWVCLIPHTLEVTHLAALPLGAHVNCEADLLARYLQRLLQRQPSLAASVGPQAGASHAL